MQRLRSILTMAFGSFGLETIVYSTFSIKMILMYLLHQFRKKSQKTPKREIEKAKAGRNDYLRRKETAKL